MHVCGHIHTCTRKHRHVHAHVHTYVHVHSHVHVHACTCNTRAHTHTPATEAEQQHKSKVPYLLGKLTILIHLPDFFPAQTANHLPACTAIEGRLRTGSLGMPASTPGSFIHRVVLQRIFNGCEAVRLPAEVTKKNIWLVQVLWMFNYLGDYVPGARFLLGKRKQ